LLFRQKEGFRVRFLLLFIGKTEKQLGVLVVIVLGFLRGNSNSKLAIGAIFFGLVGNLILGSDRLKR